MLISLSVLPTNDITMTFSSCGSPVKGKNKLDNFVEISRCTACPTKIAI